MELGNPSFFHPVHVYVSITIECNTSWLTPWLSPLGVHSLIQRHTNRIHLTDRTIEVCFEVSMGTQRLFDMARAAMFGVQLNWLEVIDVVY